MKIQHAKPVDIPVEITMSQREFDMIYALFINIGSIYATPKINNSLTYEISEREVFKLIGELDNFKWRRR